jgi:hypothetical protein
MEFGDAQAATDEPEQLIGFVDGAQVAVVGEEVVPDHLDRTVECDSVQMIVVEGVVGIGEMHGRAGGGSMGQRCESVALGDEARHRLRAKEPREHADPLGEELGAAVRREISVVEVVPLGVDEFDGTAHARHGATAGRSRSDRVMITE